jgi:acyl-CoA thioester hydrolase
VSERITTEVSVRFSDLDAAGIVNNAVYATYFEEARVQFLLERLDLASFRELPIVVASQELQYDRPITEMTTVAVTVECSNVGESSFTLSYELRIGDEVVATGETVQVIVDPSTGESQPLPDAWHDRLG